MTSFRGKRLHASRGCLPNCIILHRCIGDIVVSGDIREQLYTCSVICCNLQTASTYICCSASKSIADDYLVLTQIIPREYNVHFFVSSVFVVLNISIDVLVSIMLVLVLSEAASSHIIIIDLNIWNNCGARTQLLITFLDSESKKKVIQISTQLLVQLPKF